MDTVYRDRAEGLGTGTGDQERVEEEEVEVCGLVWQPAAWLNGT